MHAAALNSALIIHLMARVQQLIAGHRFGTWTYFSPWCVSPRAAGAQAIEHLHTTGCFLLTVARHSVKMSW